MFSPLTPAKLAAEAWQHYDLLFRFASISSLYFLFAPLLPFSPTHLSLSSLSQAFPVDEWISCFPSVLLFLILWKCILYPPSYSNNVGLSFCPCVFIFTQKCSTCFDETSLRWACRCWNFNLRSMTTRHLRNRYCSYHIGLLLLKHPISIEMDFLLKGLLYDGNFQFVHEFV